MEIGVVKDEKSKVNGSSKDDKEREEPHKEGDQDEGLLLLREHSDHGLDGLVSVPNV